MLDELTKNLIEKAEKIRYELVGSSDVVVYITRDNYVMLVCDDRILYYTQLPDEYSLHSDFAYNSTEIKKYHSMNENNTIETLDPFIYSFGDLRTLNLCREKYTSYILPLSRMTPIVEDTLIDNESFIRASKTKADDGLTTFDVMDKHGNVYKIPYYSGLFKIRKSDKFSIKVYNFTNIHRLIEITKHKSKSMSVKIIYMTLILY